MQRNKNRSILIKHELYTFDIETISSTLLKARKDLNISVHHSLVIEFIL